ncbi:MULTISPECIES: ferredoxin family protein [Streptomyces]|uniref:4Fe-4S dicluster domain-containing protein n=1 Tax=Streptomyces TaxID=1883 RepID=UPI001D0A3F32|nr:MULTISPECIES: ferredoxin family protein [Streptomyces]MCX5084259.1 ferredoxin family protein [Streptomyces sp. NBC_00401]UDM04419.1 ferredoxin family protein [Streptomyces longhuiensis]
MAYVIGASCVDIMDRSCMEECPVDCIYEGERKLYINPMECIDCGACEVACPEQAITVDRKADPDFREDNRRFFVEVLPGRETALGSPGGANGLGPVGIDTALVSAR